MAKFKILKGQSTNLPASKVEGQMYVTIDQPAIYVDIDSSTRLKLASGDLQTRVGAIQTLLEDMEVIDYVQQNQDGSYVTAHILGWTEYTPAPTPPTEEWVELFTTGSFEATLGILSHSQIYSGAITEGFDYGNQEVRITFRNMNVNGDALGDVVLDEVTLGKITCVFYYPEDSELLFQIMDKGSAWSVRAVNESEFDTIAVSFDSMKVEKRVEVEE